MRTHSPLLTRHRRSLRTLQICAATLSALALLLLGASLTLACPVCTAPDKVVVRWPELPTQAAVEDAQLLRVLSPATLLGFEQRAPVAAPASPGAGYELIRYFKPQQ